MCTPSNLYVVTLSTVCDAILGKGKLVLAKRPSTISLVLEVFTRLSNDGRVNAVSTCGTLSLYLSVPVPVLVLSVVSGRTSMSSACS